MYFWALALSSIASKTEKCGVHQADVICAAWPLGPAYLSGLRPKAAEQQRVTAASRHIAVRPGSMA